MTNEEKGEGKIVGNSGGMNEENNQDPRISNTFDFSLKILIS